MENAVLVGSNKSILGASDDAGIYCHRLSIIRKSNVIIRGLYFCCAIAPDDGVKIDETTNVWIDLNDMDMNHDKYYYDGLVDIINGSDYVTVSWNKIYDHFKTSLIDSNDKNGHNDIGKFHVTYHYNYFLNCYSRLSSTI